MPTVNFDSIVETVEIILAEDTNKSWHLAKLAKEIGERIGHQNLRPIISVLKTLIASGRYVGYKSDSTRGYVKWKAANDGPSNSFNKDEQAYEKLRQECNRLQGSLRNANSLSCDMETKNADLKRANEHLHEEWKKLQTRGGVYEIQIKQQGKKVRKIKELFHNQFERILALAQARRNIFLFGPSGCGKSHVCEQVAKVLGLRFAFVSCTSGMSEGILGGRLLPTGASGRFEYLISEFVDCYEKGGVFLLDEMDAADSNVLLFINAALSNGTCAIPSRKGKPYAKRHKNFICIAACNTLGTGADRLYSGRNKLDKTTLDRFQIGKVVMGYDERLEEILCPDETLRHRLTCYRTAIDSHRLERVMTTRFMADAYLMTQEAEWTQEQLDEAFFAGWREDEKTKVITQADGSDKVRLGVEIGKVKVKINLPL